MIRMQSVCALYLASEWYYTFTQSCILLVFFRCVFIHLQVPGVFDLHMRRGEWERYFCGKDAKENFPNHVVNMIEKGIPVKAELLPEIITGFYYSCHVRPKYAPVVILEPPGLWDGKIRSEVAYTFVKMFQQSSVSFLSSAVATLCR